MIFFIWILVCPLVGGVIGQSRNCPAVGVLLGLIFGPLGWLLAFLNDRREQCRECGGRLIQGARKCCHCGSEVINYLTVKCPACGERGGIRPERIHEAIACPVCKRDFPAAANLVK
ncbi:MAG: hypothetical protein WCH99_10130 [Verrucomicrobiota bacterium]